jgi:hypothetical protein
MIIGLFITPGLLRVRDLVLLARTSRLSTQVVNEFLARCSPSDLYQLVISFSDFHDEEKWKDSIPHTFANGPQAAYKTITRGIGFVTQWREKVPLPRLVHVSAIDSALFGYCETLLKGWNDKDYPNLSENGDWLLQFNPWGLRRYPILDPGLEVAGFGARKDNAYSKLKKQRVF